MANEEKSFQRSVINWFPGHMAKARREIVESLNKVDLVFELYDARIPYSSKNPMVDEIVKNKPRVVLLNKAGIADNNVTKEWIDYYKSFGVYALDIHSLVTLLSAIPALLRSTTLGLFLTISSTIGFLDE